MAKFRYSFDTGGGFVVFTAYSDAIKWRKEKITLAAVKVRVEGSVVFAGSEYTTLINFKDAGNKTIPIRIEQDNSGWNTVFEGVAVLFVPWNENESTITLTKFVNDDEYDNFISNYNIKYGYRTFSLTNHEIVYPSTISTTVTAVVIPSTGLSAANYKLTYDINGRVIRSGTEPRWAYFLLQSTIAGVHTFETMSFDYNPGSFDFVEIGLLVGGDSYQNLWVKLPTVIGATQALSDLVATAAYRFPDLLNALIPLANSSLTFTEATAVSYTGQSELLAPFTQYAWFDYTKYQLAEASDVANLDAKESSLTCKYLLDIMAKCFDLHWYLDGTALKFKHTTELTTTGTLNLSTDTAQLQRLEYIETDIPDIEVFQANDSKGNWHDTIAGEPFGKVQIYYKSSNNSLSENITKTHTFPVLTNVQSLMSGNYVPENSEHCLIETIDDTAVPRVVYGTSPYFNNRLTAGQLYGHLNKWRYGIEPDLATRLKIGIISLSETLPRPLLKIPIVNYHEDLLTDYDFNKAITTSAGSGITQSISQELNSDVLKLEIHL